MPRPNAALQPNAAAQCGPSAQCCRPMWSFSPMLRPSWVPDLPTNSNKLPHTIRVCGMTSRPLQGQLLPLLAQAPN